MIQTRRDASALRRRATYEQRIRTAKTTRARLWALVWWWLSEVHKLPDARRDREVIRLEHITKAINEGTGSDDGQ